MIKYSSYLKDNIEEINNLFLNVFSDSEGSEEGELIGDLSNRFLSITPDEDLYCFIASDNDRIIGSIIFTQMTFENSTVNAFLLSPVAIDTSCQGGGIGQELINYGINKLKNDGVELLLSYGDPNFYSKVGFQTISEELIKAPFALSMPEGWIGQSLINDNIEGIKGDSYCVEAISVASFW